MADEIANPKIKLTLDKAQAEAALAAFRGKTDDVSKALAASLGASLDATSKKIKKLADDITGGGATRALKDLEAALEKAGGASKLTGQQFDNLAARIQRLQSAGGVVPASLQQITSGLVHMTDATNKATTSTQQLANVVQSQGTAAMQGFAAQLGPLGPLLTALGPAGTAVAAAVAVTGGAMYSAASSAVELGSKVSDLSARTGLSAEALQKLDFAGALVGVSMETASAGVFKFQNALETAPDKIRALGLNVEELKAMQPDEAFREFARAIADIESPSERTAALMSVMGKAAGELMPLMRALSSESGETAQALGAVLSDDIVKQLDQIDDSAAILGKTWDGLINQIGSGIAISSGAADGFMGLAEVIGLAANHVKMLVEGFSEFKAIAGDVLDEMPALATFGGLTPGQGVLGIGAKMVTDPTGGGFGFFAEQMRRRRFYNYNTPGPAGAAMTPDEKLPESIGQLDAYIKDNDELAEKVAKVRAEIKQANEEDKKRQAELKKSAEAAKRAAEAEQKRAAAALDSYNKATLGTDMGPFSAFELKSQQEGFDRLAINGAVNMGTLAKVTNLTGDELTRATGEWQTLMRDVADGKDIFKNPKEDIKDANKETKNWSQTLADVANAAQFISPEFGKIAGFIAAGSNAIAGFKGANFSDAFSKQNLGGNLTAAMQGIGVAKGVFDQGNPLMGALSGAGIGAQFGVHGAVIGAALGGALGLAGKAIMSESEKIAKDVGRDFGVKISDELAKSIEKEGRGRLTGALLHLGEIIKEKGGIEKFGVDNAVSKTRDLFSELQRGAMTTKEVGATFDQVFGDIVAHSIDKNTGLLKQNARELVQLGRQYKIASKELDAFVQSQAQSLSGALGSSFQAMKDARDTAGSRAGQVAERQARNQLKDSGLSDDEIEARVRRAGNAAADAATSHIKIVSSKAAMALGTSIAASWEEMVRAGMSRGEAFKAIEPTVRAFREELKLAGFEGGAAFDAIEQQINIANDEVSGPLLTNIHGLSDALVNMSNLGLLNQDIFTGMTEQIAAGAAALQEQGVTGPALYAAMQPDLQKIWELQQDFGLAVDESTQKLLNEAMAAGAVGEQHRSNADQMADSLQHIADVFELVALRLGVTQQQLDALNGKTVDVTVNTTYQSTGTPPPDSGGYLDESRYGFAEGSNGLQNFGAGTVATLHGEEAVLTKTQLNRLVTGGGARGADYAPSGSWARSMSSAAMSMDAVVAELGMVRQLLRGFPSAVAMSTRDAVQIAGRR